MMELLGNYGYLGLFLGTFLAATILPFSSEILIIAILAAGYDPVMSAVVATVGNWLGSLSSYWLGWLGKWDWLEKWFKIKQETLEKQKKYIDRYKSFIAFFSWAPVVGDVLSVGLGFYKISFLKCAFWMLFGKAVRFAAWSLLYYYYGEAFINLFK